MTEEQEKEIAQVLANNAGNKMTIEVINGLFSSIKNILKDSKNGD